jgi:UDP-N-acetylmuramyl pentapeptide synthase
LVVVGTEAEDLARGARDAGLGAAHVRVCADPASAAQAVIGIWRSGDVILVKGSRGAADDPIVQRRGARMAEVVRLLEEAGSRP